MDKPHAIALFFWRNLTCLFALLWFLNLFVHNSIGVDREQVIAGQVVTRHYRLRWPGNGSVQVGMMQHRYPEYSEPLVPYDLAQGLLEPPLKGNPQSLWNRAGVWQISETYWHQELQSWSSEFWWGIPAWMPVLLASLGWWRVQSKRLTSK